MAKNNAINSELENPVIDGNIAGTAFLDEDDMASNSATKVVSQQSIVAYVDKKPYIINDSTGGLVINNTVAVITLDDVIESNANYSFASGVVTVLVAGVYSISFCTTVTFASNGSTTIRGSWKSYIDRDTGGGAVQIDQLAFNHYWREESGYDTITGSGLVRLTAGDELRLMALMAGAPTTNDVFSTIADRSSISIKRIGD